MNSPVDDPKKGWLSWYGRVLEETRTELPFGKKLQAIFRRSRCVRSRLLLEVGRVLFWPGYNMVIDYCAFWA